MFKFSESQQAFFHTSFEYPELPDDVVDVTIEQHEILYQKLNSGCRVFSDLSTSEPRPSQYHSFIDGKWCDKRTNKQKKKDYQSTLIPLTRRQFMLCLVKYELDDAIQAEINNIQDVKQRKLLNIEFKDAQTFERFSEPVLSMMSLIALDESKINEMWEHAMTL